MVATLGSEPEYETGEVALQIERVDGDITYQKFLDEYLTPNRPVILRHQLVSSWPAFDLWTVAKTESETRGPLESDSRINWRYLVQQYGEEEVSVADCSTCDSFGNLECETAIFEQVASQWMRGEGQHLYVKDWHLARNVECTGSASSSASPPTPFYTIPDIFKDDWMNAYYTACTSDDFRFVYVGTAGTFTPLHRDVYCSYSWSSNICGRKRWWLFPPEYTSHLFMEGRRVTVHDVRHVDELRFPYFRKAQCIVVEQEAGETIFVPSGWYHQVENLTDCISINHNWCNSNNLPALYMSMCEKVVEVEDALDDVQEMMVKSSHDKDEWKREFSAVVQNVVKHDAGWNWLTFWSMIAYVLERMHSPVKLNGLAASFPVAPPHLRPPDSVVLVAIRTCYDDFVRRDRVECTGDVALVITRISCLLNEASPSS